MSSDAVQIRPPPTRASFCHIQEVVGDWRYTSGLIISAHEESKMAMIRSSTFPGRSGGTSVKVDRQSNRPPSARTGGRASVLELLKM
jgi:hypothetical protein